MKKRILILGSVLALTSLALAFPDKAQGMLRACFGGNNCALGQGGEICCDPVVGQATAKP